MSSRVSDRCSTCGGAYDKFETSFCSDAFHCCRDCTWKQGRLTLRCAYHFRLALQDEMVTDILETADEDILLEVAADAEKQ